MLYEIKLAIVLAISNLGFFMLGLLWNKFRTPYQSLSQDEDDEKFKQYERQILELQASLKLKSDVISGLQQQLNRKGNNTDL